MPTELYGKKFESWISFVPNPFPVILFVLLFFGGAGQDYNGHNQDNITGIWFEIAANFYLSNSVINYHQNTKQHEFGKETLVSGSNDN